jgi:2-oxoglutarate ferredoxin oxidoreductase subunit beta
MSTAAFDTGEKITWCPGCGNFGILNAVKQAILQLGLPRERIVEVSGIGCHGKMTDYVKVNGLHVIHGRVLPVATGIKLSNHDLTVIGHAGDGDAFGIGLGHFAHAARRNVPISYITHDNMVYGLTTGQTSPTSLQGFVTKTSPRGVFEEPINPIAQALAAHTSFVARGYVGDIRHLVEVLKQAFMWRGFSLVDILQPCVTFNKVNTYEFYRERVYKLEESGYDSGDYEAASSKAWEWGEKIPIGVIYKKVRPTYLEAFPQLKRGPLALQPLQPSIRELFKEYR